MLLLLVVLVVLNVRAELWEEVERWLVVVESPSKARTIQGYLQHLASDPEPPLSLVTAADAEAAAGGEAGSAEEPEGAVGVRGRKREFSVLATHGHVRDVPNKVDAVSPEADFAIDWRILPQAVPHFRAIAQAAFRSQGVVLATDADREGEAIAWHVYQLLKGAAAARRRAEAQQREKEQRREKMVQQVREREKRAAAARRRAEAQQREKEQRRERMVQQAVLLEQQLAAEAQEAAEEGGAVCYKVQRGGRENPIFSPMELLLQSRIC
ncbi:unnamed protein product [Closterium sp. Yama58-4]|nr:unnamed protein product [Closterium sp. Yama58-4]